MHGAKLTDANLSNQFFDENSMSANEGGSFFEGANFTRAIRYGAQGFNTLETEFWLSTIRHLGVTALMNSDFLYESK